MDTEAQKDDANAPKNATSLKTVLTQIHKTEYFLSRLKQLHDENEQYIQVLQSILHSLLQLDEMTKANGTNESTFRNLRRFKISTPVFANYISF